MNIRDEIWLNPENFLFAQVKKKIQVRLHNEVLRQIQDQIWFITRRQVLKEILLGFAEQNEKEIV